MNLWAKAKKRIKDYVYVHEVSTCTPLFPNAYISISNRWTGKDLEISENLIF